MKLQLRWSFSNRTALLCQHFHPHRYVRTPPGYSIYFYLNLQRKTMTETKERKLQNKIQLLEAKLETLELEVSAAKR